jgi:hypothetical protein
MTASLTERRPPPTRSPIVSLHARKRPSTAGYWVAAVVAALGLTAAFLWGAVGIHTTGDRVDGFARLAVPGTTVSVTSPGTMVVYHESAAEVAGYDDPAANGRIASTRWDPATRTIVTVPNAGETPTWQQLGLAVTGPDGAPVPIATYRSSARYNLEPGRAGRAVATFPASTAGPYRVTAATSTDTSATLAVGQDITGGMVLTRLGAVILALVTVFTALPLAVATYQARSPTVR